MKVLHVEKDGMDRFKVWISKAALLSTYPEATSAVLSIDNEIHANDSRHLRKKKSDLRGPEKYEPRCAGVIEATDAEMAMLKDFGYDLADLRETRLRDIEDAL
jgi:hypothetical protein